MRTTVAKTKKRTKDTNKLVDESTCTEPNNLDHTYNIRLTNNSTLDYDDDFCSGKRNAANCQ